MSAHAVFVSSTFIDLAEHRETVQKALRQLGAVDVSMENLGARDERPKAECIRIISEDVDWFVGIYAYRYGHIPKGDRKSITEAEYDAASQSNRPRFIYLVNEDAPWPSKLIDGGVSADKLAKFKQRVSTTHICKRFFQRMILQRSSRQTSVATCCLQPCPASVATRPEHRARPVLRELGQQRSGMSTAMASTGPAATCSLSTRWHRRRIPSNTSTFSYTCIDTGARTSLMS